MFFSLMHYLISPFRNVEFTFHIKHLFKNIVLYSPSVDNFMKMMESDAEDRHKRRQRRQEKANGVYEVIFLAWISSCNFLIRISLNSAVFNLTLYLFMSLFPQPLKKRGMKHTPRENTRRL